MHTPVGAGAFRLRPDIVIDAAGARGPTIIDTKWKANTRSSDQVDRGATERDMYQLFAYVQRYDAAAGILLYPRVEGVVERSYRTADEGRHLRVAYVDLGVDLLRNRQETLTALAHCLAHSGPLP